jgi:hypothetical protein
VADENATGNSRTLEERTALLAREMLANQRPFLEGLRELLQLVRRLDLADLEDVRLSLSGMESQTDQVQSESSGHLRHWSGSMSRKPRCVLFSASSWLGHAGRS